MQVSFSNPYIREYHLTDEEIKNGNNIINLKGYSTNSIGTNSNSVSETFAVDAVAPIEDSMETATNEEGNRVIKVSASDSESGLEKIILQLKENGTWIDNEEVDITAQADYASASAEFIVNVENFGNTYRIAYYDHIGNVSYSDEFKPIDFTLSAKVSKLNGDMAMAGEVLIFKQHGDMEATVSVDLAGYVDKVTYTLPDALKLLDNTLKDDEHSIVSDTDGNAIDTFSFIIPEGVELNYQYAIKVTAWRGNQSKEQTLYIEVIELLHNIHARIRYQSGME